MSNASVSLRSAKDVSTTFGRSCGFESTSLVSALSHHESTVEANVVDDRSEGKHLLLRYGRCPVLALDEPMHIESGKFELQPHIEIVARSNSNDCDVGRRVEAERPEKGCDLLLVVAPVAHARRLRKSADLKRL